MRWRIMLLIVSIPVVSLGQSLSGYQKSVLDYYYLQRVSNSVDGSFLIDDSVTTGKLDMAGLDLRYVSQVDFTDGTNDIYIALIVYTDGATNALDTDLRFYITGITNALWTAITGIVATGTTAYTDNATQDLWNATTNWARTNLTAITNSIVSELRGEIAAFSNYTWSVSSLSGSSSTNPPTAYSGAWETVEFAFDKTNICRALTIAPEEIETNAASFIEFYWQENGTNSGTNVVFSYNVSYSEAGGLATNDPLESFTFTNAVSNVTHTVHSRQIELDAEVMVSNRIVSVEIQRDVADVADDWQGDVGFSKRCAASHRW